MVLFLVLYFWHFLDVREGAAASGDGFLIRNYLLLGAAAFSGCAGLYYLSFVKKAAVPVVFAAAALIFGCLNIFVFRGLSAPDEVSHYISAYRLSNLVLGKEAADEYGRVYVRPCDLYLEDTEGRAEEIRAAEDRGTPLEDTSMVVFGQTLDEEVYRTYEYSDPGSFGELSGSVLSCQWSVNTIPTAYLPQAAGITAARLLGFGPLGLITAGKLCNLLFFTGMVTAALWLLPYGAGIFGGAALLPMTLHLAGSMSYDIYVISMSFLFLALVFRMREQELPGKKELAGAAVILALLGPCKLVYSLLILMLPALVPAGSGRKLTVRRLLLYFVICAALLGITMYLVNHHTLNDYASADERIITWAEEPEGYTLSYLIHRPLETLRILYNSFLMRSGNWFSTMFGIYLGNQDPVYNVPYPVIGLLAAGLLVLAAGSGIRLNVFGRVLCAGTFLLVLGALMGSMLIAYTPMSSPYIEGVQGRYLLPVLPLLLMSIPGEWISLKRPPERTVLWLFTVAEAYVLIRVFATVCLRL